MSESYMGASNRDVKSVETIHLNTTKSSKSHKHQGEKIQNLKHQIERQMKAYAKQEEYEEMLKLAKVSLKFSKAFVMD